jgi:hypothetical protein
MEEHHEDEREWELEARFGSVFVSRVMPGEVSIYACKQHESGSVGLTPDQAREVARALMVAADVEDGAIGPGNRAQGPQYYAFSHWREHPSGGMGDYLGAFKTLDDACEAICKDGRDDYEVATVVDGLLTTIWGTRYALWHDRGKWHAIQ